MNAALGKLSFNKRNELRMVSAFQRTLNAMSSIAMSILRADCPEEERERLYARHKQLNKAAFKLQRYAMEYAK
ncbi:TPA: hypothetical protein PX836_003838 [Escherichia coli]|nr:hypothetical protein [Escherichia coli]